MSWKADANKAYEERVVNDALARLANRIDLNALPFSNEELRTLARRFRESFYGSEKKRGRLDRYKAHLARIHGEEVVASVSSALEEINNAIGYEEK